MHIHCWAPKTFTLVSKNILVLGALQEAGTRILTLWEKFEQGFKINLHQKETQIQSTQKNLWNQFSTSLWTWALPHCLHIPTHTHTHSHLHVIPGFTSSFTRFPIKQLFQTLTSFVMSLYHVGGGRPCCKLNTPRCISKGDSSH